MICERSRDEHCNRVDARHFQRGRNKIRYVATKASPLLREEKKKERKKEEGTRIAHKLVDHSIKKKQRTT